MGLTAEARLVWLNCYAEEISELLEVFSFRVVAERLRVRGLRVSETELRLWWSQMEVNDA